MSREESLCGNTRRPRSTFKGTPSSSSNRAITCAGGQAASAEYKKRGLRRTCFKNSCSSQAFVRLQRPLPVISSFLPGVGMCSSTVTRWPARTAHPAQNNPAAPAPMMTTSAMAHAPFPLSVETARPHNYFVLYPIFPFAARPHMAHSLRPARRLPFPCLPLLAAASPLFPFSGPSRRRAGPTRRATASARLIKKQPLEKAAARCISYLFFFLLFHVLYRISFKTSMASCSP